MKIIIAGSRTITDIPKTYESIESFNLDIKEVVCGMAPGVDTIGRCWAAIQNIPVKEFPADWNKHGKAAGPIRNKQMADYADEAIVIWDGESRGSKNMIETMKKLGKPVYEVKI